MNTNMEKLRDKMAALKLSPEDMARKIGVDPSTFYRKIKSEGVNFTVGQMHKIADVLHLTSEEATIIFLSNNSQ
ncbi:MAG: helix-turn-helix transcriptional regulator [Oscillospiraceae bacterium]|nr:helix-turn-helix transcriptional regulator [Oscillospiraceae bacterium]